jgi:hypothetical protein
MRTPRSAAIFAASSVSTPIVRRPSLSRMIAAESKEPGGTGVISFGATFGLPFLSRLRERGP